MRKILAAVSLGLLLSGCVAAETQRPQPLDTAEDLPKPAATEVSFCRWWPGWWQFPNEESFRLPDAELSQVAFDRSLEIVRRQPLYSDIGIDWFALTDRYGKAMLAVGERAYMRSEYGWGTVLDQVSDSYWPINDACVDVNVLDRLPRE